MIRHLGNRPVLRMDELAEMTDLRPRLEKGDIKLPNDARGNKNRIFFFSVDGTLRGNRFTGCLLGGECIMVQAENFEKAFAIAKDGLADTPQIARDYFDELTQSLVVTSPLEASNFNIDVGGGRSGAAVDPRGDLATDPKLKDMIKHLIGKTPWTG